MARSHLLQPGSPRAQSPDSVCQTAASTRHFSASARLHVNTHARSISLDYLGMRQKQHGADDQHDCESFIHDQAATQLKDYLYRAAHCCKGQSVTSLQLLLSVRGVKPCAVCTLYSHRRFAGKFEILNRLRAGAPPPRSPTPGFVPREYGHLLFRADAEGASLHAAWSASICCNTCITT